jgi:hypothetical protein
VPFRTKEKAILQGLKPLAVRAGYDTAKAVRSGNVYFDKFVAPSFKAWGFFFGGQTSLALRKASPWKG